jgi:hypothetical protein
VLAQADNKPPSSTGHSCRKTVDDIGFPILRAWQVAKRHRSPTAASADPGTAGAVQSV